MTEEKEYFVDWKKGKIISKEENEANKFDWSNYNKSQMKEKALFVKLLGELCNTIKDEYCGKGRKPTPLSKQIYCICLKTYLGTSSRRLISDIEICKKHEKLPHFNSVLNYLNNKSVTSYLHYLIGVSALPLSQLEDKFAIDSSGFSEHKYKPRWSVIRQEHSQHRQYKKAHCIYGTYSNIIASVTITGGTANDSPHFKQLLKNATMNFNVAEISADKAYSSRENYKFADSLNVSPFILFKKNARSLAKGARLWNSMYWYFKKRKEEYLEHYHLRSNAESGFFMIKQKFGDSVSGKNETSQINEILAKVLCHNICVLIQELFLSGIEVDFHSCTEKYKETN